jgi:hypothetical protein
VVTPGSAAAEPAAGEGRAKSEALEAALALQADPKNELKKAALLAKLDVYDALAESDVGAAISKAFTGTPCRLAPVASDCTLV